MIPSGIMFGQLKMKAQETDLEIRALDLAGSFLTFRLPVGVVEDTGVIEEIDWYFFDWERKGFEQVCLKAGDFTVSLERTTPDYQLFIMETEAVDFKSQAGRLTLEYLDFIQNKNSMDFDELAHEYTGERYPLGETITGLDTLKDIDLSELFRLTAHRGLKVAMAVESRADQERLECLGPEKYLGSKFKNASVTEEVNENPAGRICSVTSSVRGLVFGNQFCYNLIPTYDSVVKVFEDALRFWEGDGEARVVLALPPIPEFKYKEICRLLAGIDERFHGSIEYIVNDLGMERFLQGLGAGASRGMLMTKGMRDPRKKYMGEICPEKLTSNLCVTGDTVYWPLYQTNTGTFCTLYAACAKGDRGQQSRVQQCPVFCDRFCFRYPDHLNMIGRFNSLFGISGSPKEIEELTEGPAGRLSWVILNL